MAFDKQYYEDRKKEAQEEINQVVNRLMKDIYNFVEDHQRVSAKFKRLLDQEAQSKNTCLK